MSIDWLPDTAQGRMVGDYISTSFVHNDAVPFFAVANPPSGGSFLQAATCGSRPATASPALPRA